MVSQAAIHVVLVSIYLFFIYIFANTVIRQQQQIAT